jgi:hypothetical protein
MAPAAPTTRAPDWAQDQTWAGRLPFRKVTPALMPAAARRTAPGRSRGRRGPRGWGRVDRSGRDALARVSQRDGATAAATR